LGDAQGRLVPEHREQRADLRLLFQRQRQDRAPMHWIEELQGDPTALWMNLR
jgi:hypothetical protein